MLTSGPQRKPPQSSPDRLGGDCGQESPSALNTEQGQLPILFKIVQASRKILEAVDLFVALATVKLKSLISKNAVQLGGKRVGARETRSVSSGDSKDLAGFPGRHTGLESAGQKHVVR